MYKISEEFMKLRIAGLFTNMINYVDLSLGFISA